jgi:hypothetical protein
VATWTGKAWWTTSPRWGAEKRLAWFRRGTVSSAGSRASRARSVVARALRALMLAARDLLQPVLLAIRAAQPHLNPSAIPP